MSQARIFSSEKYVAVGKDGEKLRYGDARPAASSGQIIYAQNTLRDFEKHLPEFIRRRAYELFERRGRGEGQEVDDWLQAERELRHHFGNQ
jgi:hypothetical protein